MIERKEASGGAGEWIPSGTWRPPTTERTRRKPAGRKGVMHAKGRLAVYPVPSTPTP